MGKGKQLIDKVTKMGGKYVETMHCGSAIQRSANDLYKFNKDISDVARSVSTGQLHNLEGDAAKNMNKKVKDTFSMLKSTDSDFAKVVEGKKGKDLNHAQEISDYYSANKSTFDARKQMHKQNALGVKKSGTVGEKFKTYRDSNYDQTWKGNVHAGADVAGAYFFGEGKKSVVRSATAVGGYMGVNAGIRGLNGGSLTRNNNGESDIAGIPFI